MRYPPKTSMLRSRLSWALPPCFFLFACHAAPPVHAVPAAHPPEIHAPADREEVHEEHARPREATGALTEIVAEFVAGPAPAPPSEAPIASIRLRLDRAGRLERTVVRLGGSRETTARPLDAELNDRIWALAERAARAAPFDDEGVVPDGERVTLALVRGREAVRFEASVPTRHAELAPLLRELTELRR